MAVFRNELNSQDDAFWNAYNALSGICDGYSLLLEERLPSICSVVQIREGAEADSALFVFTVNRGKLRFHSPDGSAEQRWDDRQQKLMSRFLPLFDVLTDSDVHLSQSEVSEQLKLSLKMYRHGCVASNIGIEFLCKFTTLEGLVCGDQQYGKEKLLKARLGSLFRSLPNVSNLVSKLWKLRCEASHQGKAFSERFVQATADVELLITGTVVFTAEHMKTAQTHEELWSKSESFVLPAEALLQPETLRGRISRSWGDAKIKCNGIGPIVDHLFAPP